MALQAVRKEAARGKGNLSIDPEKYGQARQALEDAQTVLLTLQETFFNSLEGITDETAYGFGLIIRDVKERLQKVEDLECFYDPTGNPL